MWNFEFLRFHHQLIKKHWTYFLVYNIILPFGRIINRSMKLNPNPNYEITSTNPGLYR